MKKLLLLPILVLFCSNLFAQNVYNDGQIQLKIWVHKVWTTSDCSDIFGADPTWENIRIRVRNNNTGGYDYSASGLDIHFEDKGTHRWFRMDESTNRNVPAGVVSETPSTKGYKIFDKIYPNSAAPFEFDWKVDEMYEKDACGSWDNYKGFNANPFSSDFCLNGDDKRAVLSSWQTVVNPFRSTQAGVVQYVQSDLTEAGDGRDDAYSIMFAYEWSWVDPLPPTCSSPKYNDDEIELTVRIRGLWSDSDFDGGVDCVGGLAGNEELRLRYNIRDNISGYTGWNIQKYAQPEPGWNNTGPIQIFNKTYTSYTDFESFTLDLETWEEDGCGSDNTYDTGCTFNDDNEHYTGTKTVNWRDSPPNTWNSVDLVLRAGSSNRFGNWTLWIDYMYELSAPTVSIANGGGYGTGSKYDRVICNASSTTIYGTATNATYYQWQVADVTSPAGSGCPTSVNWTDINNANARCINYTPPKTLGTRIYRLKVMNRTGSGSTTASGDRLAVAYSECVRVTYLPYAPPIQSTICGAVVYPGTTGAFSVVVPPHLDGVANVTYAWTVSPSTGVSISSATASATNITFNNGGSYTVTLTTSGGGCSNATSTCSVNVATAPSCDWYVTPGGTGGGTIDDPASLSQALSNAGSGDHIKLARGTYTLSATIFVPSGVILDGGYNVSTDSWVKSTSNNASSANGTILNIAASLYTSSSSGQYPAVRLNNAPNVYIKDLRIVNTRNPGTATTGSRGRTLYGVHASNSSNFYFSRLDIRTNYNASNGANGSGGANGANGSGGIHGHDGDNDDHNNCTDGSAYGGVAGHGGRGGGRTGSTSPTGGAQQCDGEYGAYGTNGSGRTAGNGGGGGSGSREDGANARRGGSGGARGNGGGGGTYGNGWNDDDGGNGLAGSNGAAGAAGSGYNTSNRATNYSYSTYFLPGTIASSGGNGYGGAGGGGGGGGADQSCGGCNDGSGAGGGGGGGGGQGGAAGGGAYGGGGNFGIYAQSSTTGEQVRDYVFNIGSAGIGGTGGAGGSGGSGGSGASGGVEDEVGNGGRGGNGGSGGSGGRGQYGANGLRANTYSVATVSGGSIPTTHTLTTQTWGGCTNSEYVFTKNTGTWQTYGAFVDNQYTGSSSYTTGTNSVKVYYTTTGHKNIVISGVTYRNFIYVDQSRTLPVIDNINDICLGESVTISTAESAQEYEFVVDNDNNLNTAVSFTVDEQTQEWTPTVAGTYYIRLRAKDLCCGWSRPVYESFVVHPHINSNTIATPSPNNFCESGNPGTIVGSTPTGGTGSYAYQWILSVDGGAWASVIGATSKDYNPPNLSVIGVYEYKRIVNSNCTDTSNSVFIYINPDLEDNNVVNTGPSAYCPPIGTYLDFSTMNGSPPVGGNSSYSYEWQRRDSTSSGWTSWASESPNFGWNSQIYDPPGFTILAGTPIPMKVEYRRIVTSGGCTNTSNSEQIIIDRAATNPTSIDATPDVVCANNGNNITLTASGGNALFYIWSSDMCGGDTVGYSNGANPLVIPQPNVTTTYYARAVDECYNPSPGCLQVTVTVKDPDGLVTLFSGSNLNLIEQCVVDGWTYYSTVANPDEYLFAIRKNVQSTTPVFDVDLDMHSGVISSVHTGANPHGSYLMRRYWNVNLVSGSIANGIDIRFYYDPADMAAAVAARDVDFVLYNGSTKGPTPQWFKTNAATLSGGGNGFLPSLITPGMGNNWTFPFTFFGPGSSSGTQNGVAYVQFDGLTSLSGGTGGTTFGESYPLLPVELISFTVQPLDSDILLNWQTATEINNDKFIVERSIDGINFEAIGEVEGNGTTSELHDYSFLDDNVVMGITYYYRLKQVDFDGAYDYTIILSATIEIENQSQFEIGDLYPNPAGEFTNVPMLIPSKFEGEANVQVYSVIGKLVHESKLDLIEGSNVYTLDISEIPDGNYIINFEAAFGLVTKKLTVVRVH